MQLSIEALAVLHLLLLQCLKRDLDIIDLHVEYISHLNILTVLSIEVLSNIFKGVIVIDQLTGHHGAIFVLLKDHVHFLLPEVLETFLIVQVLVIVLPHAFNFFHYFIIFPLQSPIFFNHFLIISSYLLALNGVDYKALFEVDLAIL